MMPPTPRNLFHMGGKIVDILIALETKAKTPITYCKYVFVWWQYENVPLTERSFCSHTDRVCTGKSEIFSTIQQKHASWNHVKDT